MKKAFAILMLVIFLFNVGGYFLAFLAFDYKLNKELTYRLDRNLYSEDETYSLKIPMSLPYPIQQQDFERVDGRFEYEGEFYKLVKHKLENDTLHIVCIKHQEQKELVNTLHDYVKLSNDLPAAAKQTMSLIAKLLKDFNQNDGTVSLVNISSQDRTLKFVEYASPLLTRPIPIHSPPPKG